MTLKGALYTNKNRVVNAAISDCQQLVKYTYPSHAAKIASIILVRYEKTVLSQAKQRDTKFIGFRRS